MCWEFELLILYIVLEKKSRSLDHSFLLLNHLVSSFLLGGLGFEGRTGRRARHASENIIVVLSVFFPRTMAWSWCLMGLASSQGQQDSLKLSRIIQLWNAPFSFTEYPKSQTKYGPKVLGFKEFSHVKSVLIFCSLNSLVEEKWPVEVTVSVLSVAGESGPNQPAAGGLPDSSCTMSFSTSVPSLMSRPCLERPPPASRHPRNALQRQTPSSGVSFLLPLWSQNFLYIPSLYLFIDLLPTLDSELLWAGNIS